MKNKNNTKIEYNIVKSVNGTSCMTVIPKHLCRAALHQFIETAMRSLPEREKNRYAEKALKDFNSPHISVQTSELVFENVAENVLLGDNDPSKIIKDDLGQQYTSVTLKTIMGLFGDELARENIQEMAERDADNIVNFECSIESFINHLHANSVKTDHDNSINPLVKSGVVELSGSLELLFKAISTYAETADPNADIPVRVFLSTEDIEKSFLVKLNVSYGENDLEQKASERITFLFLDKETGKFDVALADKIGVNTVEKERFVDMSPQELTALLQKQTIILPPVLAALLEDSYKLDSVKTEERNNETSKEQDVKEERTPVFAKTDIDQKFKDQDKPLQSDNDLPENTNSPEREEKYDDNFGFNSFDDGFR